MNGPRALPLLFMLGACTFGGSSEDPSVMVFPRLDAAADVGLPVVDAEPDEPAPDEPAPTEDGGGEPDRAISEPDAGVGDAASAQCEPEEPAATCDPVRNTGCPALTQCEVESSASVRTGRCVFPQAPTTAECSVLPLATVCAPRFTCLGSACVALCDCDDDCPDRECCQQDSGSPAILFKVCRPC